MRTTFFLAAAAIIASSPLARAANLCPDGSYVNGPCTLAPNGTYTGGRPQLAPDGSYTGGQPRLAPNGSYVGVPPPQPVSPGGAYGNYGLQPNGADASTSRSLTLCPDGSYVSGRCELAPNGRYVGKP